MKEENIKEFNRDAKNNDGYVYTTNGKYSSAIANQNYTRAIHKLCGSLKNKTIIDIGCGDGTYTVKFLTLNPKYILGIDPAQNAINIAQKKYKQHQKILQFKVGNIYNLNKINQHFDIAIVRGVLHHLYQAPKAIKQISKITNTAIILEPNGYNPVLKIIEKLSPYHKEHEEKSYSPQSINSWVENNNGKVVSGVYCGLVPFFCPKPIAKLLKLIEPSIEKIPIVATITCGVYLVKVNFLNK